MVISEINLGIFRKTYAINVSSIFLLVLNLLERDHTVKIDFPC
jgi:hypothetical protein